MPSLRTVCGTPARAQSRWSAEAVDESVTGSVSPLRPEPGKLAPVQHALAIVIGIGLVDSANPATIVPALYLAAGPNGVKSLAGFIAGFAAANLALGVADRARPGRGDQAARPPRRRPRHAT